MQRKSRETSTEHARYSGQSWVWLNQPHPLFGFAGYKPVWWLWNNRATSPTDGQTVGHRTRVWPIYKCSRKIPLYSILLLIIADLKTLSSLKSGNMVTSPKISLTGQHEQRATQAVRWSDRLGSNSLSRLFNLFYLEVRLEIRAPLSRKLKKNKQLNLLYTLKNS